MKKGGDAFLTLIALSLVFLLASCSSQTSRFALQKEYRSQSAVGSPYFFFDTDTCTWRTGQGIAYDYSLSGEYSIKGDILVCNESYRDLSVEIELTGNDTIRIVSLNDNDGILDWLNGGDVLTSFSEDS